MVEEIESGFQMGGYSWPLWFCVIRWHSLHPPKLWEYCTVSATADLFVPILATFSNSVHFHYLPVSISVVVFPGEPGLAGSPSVFFLHLFQKRTYGYKCAGFLWTRCSSCHPTNSVKAPKETQSTEPNRRPCLVLISSTAGFL